MESFRVIQIDQGSSYARFLNYPGTVHIYALWTSLLMKSANRLANILAKIFKSVLIKVMGLRLSKMPPSLDLFLTALPLFG